MHINNKIRKTHAPFSEREIKCVNKFTRLDCFLQRISQWIITSAPFMNLIMWREPTSGCSTMRMSVRFYFLKYLQPVSSTWDWQTMNLMMLNRDGGNSTGEYQSRVVKWTLLNVSECVWDFGTISRSNSFYFYCLK